MTLLAAHAAATWAMVGILWFVQLAHYPLFTAVPPGAFPAYQAANIRATAGLVAPLMLAEGLLALALAWRRRDAPAWAGLALLAAVWASTAFIQFPLHRALLAGFDPALHERLLLTNWFRTAGWSARGVLALWLLRAPQ